MSDQAGAPRSSGWERSHEAVEAYANHLDNWAHSIKRSRSQLEEDPT
jgi:hypothetical protein